MAKLLYKNLSYQMQGHIFTVRRQYGPGLKERIYGNLLAELLEQDGIPFTREERVEIRSQESGSVVGHYQPDFVVDGKIVLELKASPRPSPQDERQLYSYLRNSEYEVGYLVNFSTPKLLMKRIIYTNDRKPFLSNSRSTHERTQNRKRNITKLLCLFVFIFVSLGVAGDTRAAAQEVEMTPAIIDLEGLPMDVFEREIEITNVSGGLLSVYPTVRNLTADGGIEPFFEINTSIESKTMSLANWTELYRGRTTLEVGETKTIPVTIRINSKAEPGTYHAIIAFPSGNKRIEAEAKLAIAPQTIVTLRVVENIQESLSLLNFKGAYALSSSDPVTLTYRIENGGNRALKPEGDIILYDRRGNEIDAIPINTSGLTIPPGESVAMASVWEATSSRTGRFKAFLDLRYGEASPKALQDTAFFWVVPLPTLATIFALLLLGTVLGIFLLQRRALVKHRVRIDDWHKESAERHGSDGRKQRVRGLPHHPTMSDDAEEVGRKKEGERGATASSNARSSAVSSTRHAAVVTNTPPRIIVRGNTVDLRRSSQRMKKEE